MIKDDYGELDDVYLFVRDRSMSNISKCRLLVIHWLCSQNKIRVNKKLEKSGTRCFFLFPNVDAADTAHPAWLIKCNLWLRLMEGAARCSRPKTINEKGLLGHSLKVQRVQLIIIQLPPTRFCLCWSPLHYNRSIFLGLFLGIDKTFSQFLK